MKSTIKLFRIIAFAAVILFTMAACENEEPEDPGEKTLIYKGRDRNGTEWVLKITGDAYELTGGMGLMGGLNTSTGIVVQKVDTTYHLKPSVTAAMFSATVSPAGLVELSGTIVWYAGGMPEALPIQQLTPSGGPGSGGGAGNSGGQPTKQPENPVYGGGDDGDDRDYTDDGDEEEW
jgi:hypothetical protein